MNYEVLSAGIDCHKVLTSTNSHGIKELDS